MSHTPPSRPQPVPADAQYNADNHLWELYEHTLEGTIRHYTSWWPDGTIESITPYENGQRHGVGIDYYQDGSIKGEVDFEYDLRTEMRVYRAKSDEEDHQLIKDCAAIVHSGKVHYNADGQLLGETYYQEDGTQITAEGKPYPKHPDAVPEAAYLLEGGTWFLGRNDPMGTYCIGLIRGWHEDGTPHYCAYWLPKEEGEKNQTYALLNTDGDIHQHPLALAASQEDPNAVEDLLAFGAGSAPGSALHMAFDGHHDLAKRLLNDPSLTQGIFATAFKEPERVEGVPDEAVWVPTLKSWVQASLDPATGHILGEWKQWVHKPHIDDAGLQITTFEGGVPRSYHEYKYAEPRQHWLKKIRLFDETGTPCKRTDYDRGQKTEEFERIDAATLALRYFFDDDKVKVERRVTDGEQDLIEERWFNDEGVLTATVRPCDLVTEDDEPLEWCQCVDATGQLIAEGAAEQGCRRADLIGEWTLHYPEGQPDQTLDVSDYGYLELHKHPAMGEMLHSVFNASQQPLPASLQGINDINWVDLGGYMGLDGEDFPKLIKLLTVPGKALSEKILGILEYEILHQHTITDATGPVVQFMLRAAVSGEAADREGILRLTLEVATRDYQMAAAREIKNLIVQSRALPADQVRKRLGQIIEPAYLDVFQALTEHAAEWERLAQDGDTGTELEQRLGLHLLALVPTKEAEQALLKLIPLYAAKTGEDRQQWLGEALLCLALMTDKASIEVLLPFMSDADPVIRFAAAFALVLSHENDSAPAVPVLIEALQGGETREPYRRLLLSTGHASGDAVLALGLLPSAHSAQAIDQMLEVLAGSGSMDGIAIAGALLDIVMPKGYDADKSLKKAQHKVLSVIVDTDAIWHFINFHEVLENNNLPTDRDKLRAIVQNDSAGGIKNWINRIFSR